MIGEYYTPMELAELNGVSYSNVYNTARVSGLRMIKVGGKLVIPRAEYIAWISAGNGFINDIGEIKHEQRK